MRKYQGLFFAVTLVMVALAGCNTPQAEPGFEFQVAPSTTTFSAAGESITYTYTVSDPNVEMQVTIADDRFGQPCQPFILRPETRGGPTVMTCEVTYTTTAADVNAGSILNTATATGHASGEACCGSDTTGNREAGAEVSLEAAPASELPANPDFTVLSAGCDSELYQFYIAFDTGLDWLVPELEISYTATDATTGYSCITSRTGVIYCTGLPSENPGTLQLCLQRPTDPAPACQAFPDFPSWTAGIGCQPDWQIGTTGCHANQQIFFSMDTGFAWLVSDDLADFTASDGETSYTCTVTSTPGRVYCYGRRPDSPGPLTFCVQRPQDAAPLCQTFTDYPAYVWGFTCEGPTPTFPPPPSSPCAGLTILVCQANSLCTWDTSLNTCRPR